MDKIANIAIRSILKNTETEIVIGFTSINDISGIIKSPQITYLDLSSHATNLGLVVGNNSYESFDQDSFFSLVQLKWSLFKELFKIYPGRSIIYSDTDVVWMKDNVTLVEEIFNKEQDKQVLIQDATRNPLDIQLCMGFFAIRNSPFALELIESCANLHSHLLRENSRIGDDDVITMLAKRSACTKKIFTLPQNLFPIGSSLNLFTKKVLYPGLIPEKPFIFHANYVVGLNSKFDVLFLLAKHLKTLDLEISFRGQMLTRLRIKLKFLKHSAVTYRVNLLKAVKAR